jgi:biopolymer transport protein ExbB
MFVASTLIMIFKIIYLNRIASGNLKFMADYQSIVDDPASLESRANQNGGSPYGQSTLWRLYRLGMAETHKRIDPQQGAVEGAQQVIGGAAIEAIRATLDASQTRMGQSLGNQMVWLTISISGGPFLGLLGTVVGVMITFAAIAAAGEVNVNAIAPGTAAALVATTAGLAVAIPCLFGYNYLNTRIKEITTDMRVFVDELVARLAETYS